MIVYSENSHNVRYYKDTSILYFENTDFPKVKQYDNSKNEYYGHSFDDDTDNVLVLFQGSIYHVMIDNIGIILKHYKKNPNTRFFISMLHPFEKVYDYNFVPFLFEFLKHYKIEYHVLNPKETNPIKINNLFYYNNVQVEQNAVDDIYDYTRNFAIPQQKIHKKIYLGRKRVVPKDINRVLSNVSVDKLSFNSDQRIDDEEKLESFFKNIGFEIIYPEDFASFRDQLGFMDNVDVLVSLTGASLTNCLFMKPNKTVVELATTLILNGEETLHTHFYDMAYAKNHNFISIRHDRLVDNVINKIVKSGILVENHE